MIDLRAIDSRAAPRNRWPAAVLLAAALAAAAPAEIPVIQAHHYELLRQAETRYRDLAARTGLSDLPPLPARAVRPGERYEGSLQLARLLHALGDFEAEDLPAAADTTFNAALAEGLERFQGRHGLVTDGILGPASYRELTVALSARLRQIQLTLQRWRTLSPAFEPPPIFVNIPQFRLFALYSPDDREDEMLAMNVVVGQVMRHLRTPVFSADLTHIVFRPYWEVPRSIAVTELVPAYRERPGELAANGFEVVTPGGAALEPTRDRLDAVARGELRLRQRPGPDNALGLVKFVLPNPHNVYLHDTPARRLFDRPRRAFSHGCVRVADAAALAEYALRFDPDWNRERIRQTMHGSRTETVRLPRPIRVYFAYGTAVARENGEVLFFDDLYGHDAASPRSP